MRLDWRPSSAGPPDCYPSVSNPRWGLAPEWGSVPPPVAAEPVRPSGEGGASRPIHSGRVLFPPWRTDPLAGGKPDGSAPDEIGNGRFRRALREAAHQPPDPHNSDTRHRSWIGRQDRRLHRHPAPAVGPRGRHRPPSSRARLRGFPGTRRPGWPTRGYGSTPRQSPRGRSGRVWAGKSSPGKRPVAGRPPPSGRRILSSPNPLFPPFLPLEPMNHLSEASRPSATTLRLG